MEESIQLRRAGALLLLLSLCCTYALAGDDIHPARDSAVAKLGNQTIAYGDLGGEIPKKLDLMQHQYEVKLHDLQLNDARARSAYIEAELDNFIDRRVLSLEAAANKTTPEALLAAVQPVPVSDADMHAFFDAQSVQIGRPFEAVAPQLRQYLQNEAAKQAKHRYLASLRGKYQAAITWDPLREHIDAVGPERGPHDAVVTIVEFSDFECPFCGRFTPVLQRVLAAYPTQVRLIFRNFPLRSVHQNAEKAAEAAACAAVQGKFWEMHDVLFAEQNSLSLGALKEKAKRIGLDTQAFDNCLDSGEGARAVDQDGEAGVALGLSSTPTSFVNGRYVNAALSFEELSALIDDELQRAAAARARR